MSTYVLEDDRLEPIRLMQEKSWHLDAMERNSLSLTIACHQSLQSALALSADVKETKKQVEAIRKVAIEPSRKFISKVNDAAKVIEEVLDKIETTLKNKISIYQGQLQKKAEAERLAAEAVVKSLGVAMDIIVGDAPKKFSNSDVIASQKTKMCFEIENDSLVPLEYLMIDEDKIKKAVQMGVRDIPGVRIYETKELQIRRR